MSARQKRADYSPISLEEPPDTQPRPPTPRPKTLRDRWLAGFEDFWRRYPRKVAKKAAEKAWLSLLPRNGHLQELYERILDAIEAHAAQWEDENREPAHIPHASTWLRRESFEQEDDDP